MNCDLCGTNSNLTSAIVEGSLMNICSKCIKFGKQVERNKNFSLKEVIKYAKPELVSILKEEYNKIIKEAREKSKLTQEDLAKKLNEKTSLIQKIENKEIIPNEILTKKLEKFFKISLVENYIEKNDHKLNIQSKTLTIGDLIKIKKLK